VAQNGIGSEFDAFSASSKETLGLTSTALIACGAGFSSLINLGCEKYNRSEST
jgi:hypothetical protein